jgi:hypothetical protein
MKWRTRRRRRKRRRMTRRRLRKKRRSGGGGGGGGEGDGVAVRRGILKGGLRLYVLFELYIRNIQIIKLEVSLQNDSLGISSIRMDNFSTFTKRNKKPLLWGESQCSGA